MKKIRLGPIYLHYTNADVYNTNHTVLTDLDLKAAVWKQKRQAIKARCRETDSGEASGIENVRR